jgi:hypothetical protein
MARGRTIRAAALMTPVVPSVVAHMSAGDVVVSTPPTQTIRVATSDT